MTVARHRASSGSGTSAIPARGILTANEIHIPVGGRCASRRDTDNVIHSFWVPELAGRST